MLLSVFAILQLTFNSQNIGNNSQKQQLLQSQSLQVTETNSKLNNIVKDEIQTINPLSTQQNSEFLEESDQSFNSQIRNFQNLKAKGFSLGNFNHRWFYLNELGQKQNFDCDDSTKIEIVYQIYKLAEQEKDSKKFEDRGLTNVKLKDNSIVNIYTQEITYENGSIAIVQREQNEDNSRQIRNIYQKDIFQNFDFEVTQSETRFSNNFLQENNKLLHITNELKIEDGQWLGWNWIKAKFGQSVYEKEQNQKSKIQIFIEMINEDFEYFPSLLEIQKGIFQAFEQHLNQKFEANSRLDDKTLKQIKDLSLEYNQTWQIFFQNGLDSQNYKKPLCYKILEDPSNQVTKFLVYLHTMQTFLFQDLKIASRQKDQSKIMTLGPYALCLSYILAKAKCKKNQETLLVYRGMTMPKEVFDQQFRLENEGININMMKTTKNKIISQKGFQSTSRDKTLALEFADPSYQQKGYIGVLLKIELCQNKNYFIYDKETSAFPREQEVLLQEGLIFEILKIETKTDEDREFEYYEVHLKY